MPNIPQTLGLLESLQQSWVWQGWCWAHPWRATAQFLVLAALLSFCSTFGGLVVLHGYLAASNQTTYELSRGAKARLSSHKCI